MPRELFRVSNDTMPVSASLQLDAQPTAKPDVDGEWPIFLSRREPPTGAEAPPPIPSFHAAFGRVRPSSRSLQMILGGCATLTAVAGASGYLLTDGQRRFTWPATARALHAPSDARAPIAAAPPLAAEHVRFGFAARLPDNRESVDAMPAGPAADERIAEAAEPPELEPGLDVALASPAEPRAADDTSDPVAVMILRNLPDTAAFLAGTASADGAWVIAANEFDHVVVTALTPNAEPVSADAELISRSGLSLGVVRLPVRPSAPFMTAASDPAEVPAADAEAPQHAAQTPASELSGASHTAAAPKVRVHVRKTVTVADSGRKPKRRSKPADDAAKAKDHAPDKSHQKSDASATETADAADAKPKGPISKFFAWITGKSKPTEPGAADKDSAFSLAPSD